MPPSIIYSIFNNGDLKVTTYKGNYSINLRDVIASLDWKIHKFSEVDAIIDKVQKFPINIQTEIKHPADNIKSQFGDCNEIDIPIKKIIIFLCDQFLLCCSLGDNGRWYNADVIQTAIELMLRISNFYKASKYPSSSLY